MKNVSDREFILKSDGHTVGHDDDKVRTAKVRIIILEVPFGIGVTLQQWFSTFFALWTLN